MIHLYYTGRASLLESFTRLFALLDRIGTHLFARGTMNENLILEHRELGRKIATKMLRGWKIRLTSEEVASIVDITLCEAALNFDNTKGTQFSTYYFYYLRGNLVTTIEKNVGAQKVSEAARHCASVHSSSGTNPAVTLKDCEDEVNRKASLNLEPEMLGMRTIETPEDLILNKEKRDFVHTAMSKLDPLERVVIQGLYFSGESVQSVARKLGYSRVQISRIQKQAFAKLRSAASTCGIKNGTVEEQQIALRERTVVRRKHRRRYLSSGLFGQRLAANA